MHLQIRLTLLRTPKSNCGCSIPLFGFGLISSIRSMPSLVLTCICSPNVQPTIIDQCFWSGGAPLLTIASLCFDFAVPAVAVGQILAQFLFVFFLHLGSGCDGSGGKILVQFSIQLWAECKSGHCELCLKLKENKQTEGDERTVGTRKICLRGADLR